MAAVRVAPHTVTGSEVVAALLDRPRWRGRLHAWMFVAAFPLALVLLLVADRAMARTAVAIYAASLAGVFGVSAAYHRIAHSCTARRRLRALDHSMIYVLIAGTYTPVCLLALPRAWGVPLLTTLWAAAAAGIGLKVFGGPDRFPGVANGLYVVMGWVALIALPVLPAAIGIGGMALLGVGGVIYTVGAVVLFRRRPDPFPAVFGFHEVWHACTVVAAISHYGLILSIAGGR